MLRAAQCACPESSNVAPAGLFSLIENSRKMPSLRDLNISYPVPLPSDESLGYYRMPLRGKSLIHIANHVNNKTLREQEVAIP